jgi:hypothetical protein
VTNLAETLGIGIGIGIDEGAGPAPRGSEPRSVHLSEIR